MKYIFKAFITIVFLSLLVSPIQAADDGAKVVFHVDFKDVTRYSATLTAVNNIITFYENELMEYEVHIVFVGFGIRFVTNDPLKDSPFALDQALQERQAELAGRLDALMNVRGVKVHLCDKTRDEVSLPQSKIYDGISFPASGVGKIAILQSQGFAYLKIQ